MNKEGIRECEDEGASNSHHMNISCSNEDTPTNIPNLSNSGIRLAVGENSILSLLLQQNQMLINALRLERISFHVMPDLNNTIKKFNGKRSPSEAQDWLASINSIGNMNNWPDPFRLQCARANLEGTSLN